MSVDFYIPLYLLSKNLSTLNIVMYEIQILLQSQVFANNLDCCME